MPRLAQNRVPSYRLHKQSGRAIVTLSGKDFLLGPHGSPASRQEYNRLVAEWLANGRAPVAGVGGGGGGGGGGGHPPTADGGAARGDGPSVDELVLAYWRYAKEYYRKDGRPSAELPLVRYALRPLRDLYGPTPAGDFGPLALRAVRERMMDRGWTRKTVNNHVNRVKRLFKWAVSRELVPAGVHHALSTVEGLRRGRSRARETDPVRPVPDADVDAVIAWLSPGLAELIRLQDDQANAEPGRGGNGLTARMESLAARVPLESPVAAMVQLQRLTGMRSGELVAMRTADVDTSGDTWVYAPRSHKTEHHGRSRVVYLGPRARQILRPFLRPQVDAPLFSPAEARAARYRRMRELRRSPVQPSQVDRRKPRPRRSPGDGYDVGSYRRAIAYACKRAGVPDWHPHRLRHNCATRLRRAFGIEASRVVLGHSSAAVTELYAEIDATAAADVMAKAG